MDSFREIFAIFSLFSFLFGIIIGSFLNVIIFRLQTGRGIGGRSFCMSCGKTLSALELVPLLSFIFLKGKCKNCKTKISWQYPLVELVTGLVFFLTFLKLSANFPDLDSFALAYYFILFSILIVIAVYDMRHTIIPDTLVFIFSTLSLLGLVYFYGANIFSTMGILDFLAGPILFIPFFLFWLLSKGKWMGLGDAKLALGVGWMLGLVGGVSAIIVGFWSGALFSVTLMFLNFLGMYKKIGWKSEVPFAPFIILGVFISFLFSLDIFSLREILGLFF